MATKLPREVLVYIDNYDRDTNEPIFDVVASVDEIPEDQSGDRVGVYTLKRTAKFKVKRELD